MSPALRIGLVTCRAVPELDAGDRPLLDAFRRLGAHAVPVVWDAPDTRWDTFDALLLRSCWDYHVRPSRFHRWLEAIRAGGIPLVNPFETVRWNLDKRYLLDLEARGVHIVPTRVLEDLEDGALAALASEESWAEVVIKPSVGADAVGVLRVPADEVATLRRIEASVAHARGATLPRDVALLVQPFVPEIAGGEWSLVYLGGEYSHAAIKHPTRGEFRTQERLGGGWTPATAPGDVRDAVDRMLEVVDRPWLYARVDVVPTADGVRLMELELIEPSLLLDTEPGSADRLAGLVLGPLR